jgi:anti-anti-sigma factor
MKHTDDPVLLVDIATSDGSAVLRLIGELDAANRSKVLDAGMRLVARPSGGPILTIDMAELSFCDSSGLETLYQIQRNALAFDRIVVLRSPQPLIRRVLDLADMAHLFTIVPLD